MKRLLSIAMLLPFLSPAFGAAAESDEPPDPDAPESQLFIVHFTTGPRWQPDLPFPEQDHASAHSENLRRLGDDGILLLGARYADKGMIVIREATEDHARSQIERDPAVQAGVFVYEIASFHPFYAEGWPPNRDAAPAGCEEPDGEE